MKEDPLPPKKCTLFTEMPPVSKNKVQEPNYLLPVSRSLIYLLLMPEEEKLVFSEEPESEKPCLFKNSLTTSPKHTEVTQSSQESEKELVREMIFTMK